MVAMVGTVQKQKLPGRGAVDGMKISQGGGKIGKHRQMVRRSISWDMASAHNLPYLNGSQSFCRASSYLRACSVCLTCSSSMLGSLLNISSQTHKAKQNNQLKKPHQNNPPPNPRHTLGYPLIRSPQLHQLLADLKSVPLESKFVSHVFHVSGTSAVICCQSQNRGFPQTAPLSTEADALLQIRELKTPVSHRAGELLIA